MVAEGLSPLLAFAAGALTIRSPCVLPLVPVVLGSAAQRHRAAPFALALGLIAGFTGVGFVLAAFGSRLGIDAEQVRIVGALLLTAAGLFLLLPGAQERLAMASGPLVAWAGDRQRQLDDRGLWGQGVIGLLLGIVWSPCVGPTLGAAVALAAQGQALSQVAVTMAAFAAGIATVMLVVALAGRTLFNRFKTGVAAKAKFGKLVLGGILAAVGVLILTGIDRLIEGAIVTASPDWLVSLTTAI